jgi:hypothetical protein
VLVNLVIFNSFTIEILQAMDIIPRIARAAHDDDEASSEASETEDSTAESDDESEDLTQTVRRLRVCNPI